MKVMVAAALVVDEFKSQLSVPLMRASKFQERPALPDVADSSDDRAEFLWCMAAPMEVAHLVDHNVVEPLGCQEGHL